MDWREQLQALAKAIVDGDGSAICPFVDLVLETIEQGNLNREKTIDHVDIDNKERWTMDCHLGMAYTSSHYLPDVGGCYLIQCATKGNFSYFQTVD